MFPPRPDSRAADVCPRCCLPWVGSRYAAARRGHLVAVLDPGRAHRRVRNFDVIYTTRPIDHGGDFLPLRSEPADFSEVEYQVGGDAFGVEDYLERHFVAGLLVVKGDRILLERYRLGHDETSRWVSYSIAKSSPRCSSARPSPTGTSKTSTSR